MKLSIIFIFIISLVGCSATTIKESTNSEKKISNKSSFTLINPINANKVINDIELPRMNTSMEIKVIKQCGGKYVKPDENAVIDSVIIYGVELVVDFIVDQVDDLVKEELKEYSSIYSVNKNLNLYSKTSLNFPELKWTCFRLTFKEIIDGKEEITFDLVSQLKIVKDGDALKIRPLRFFYNKTKAKASKKIFSNSSNMGVSLSLEGNSIWLQNNIGKSAQTLSTVLLKEKLLVKNNVVQSFFDKKNKKTNLNYKYYLDKGLEKYTRLPLIPWSTNKSDKKPGGNITMIFSMAEVGNPSFILKNLNKIIGDNSKDIKKGLESAATKLLENSSD